MSKEIFEKKLVEVTEAIENDESYFPVGLSCEEGQIWLKSQQATLLWVLEVIDIGEDSEFVLSRCPWCGLLGPDFDESPMPSDYCGHDPAAVATGEDLDGKAFRTAARLEGGGA
jgi:hypothetical protein